MSELNKKLLMFFQTSIFFICLVIPFSEFVIRQNLIGINRFFFWCYFSVFILVKLIFVIFDRNVLGIPASLLGSVLLMGIFRDSVLLIHITVAFASIILIYLMDIKLINRFGWIIFAVASAVIWIGNPETPKIVAVCVIVLLVFGVFSALDNESKYYSYVLILLGTVLVFLPSKEEPFQWSHLKSAVKVVSEGTNRAANEIEYIFDGLFDGNGGYRGHSDDAKLTGGVGGNSKEELKLDPYADIRSKYLFGAAYKTITPEGMTDKVRSDEAYKGWFVEFVNALYRAGIDREEAVCFCKIEKINIQFKYLRTEDIIIPGYPIRVEYEYFKDKDSRERHGKGFMYSVRYMVVDYASPYFIEVVENGAGDYISYEDFKNYAYETLSIDIRTFLSEKEYSEALEFLAENNDYSDYLDTSMLTPEIQKLAEDVTKDFESDFDKAKALETFLRGYKYDSKVDLRDSDNYIEDFLFEECKGYCIHYAASMVLMLRSCNIPARYVSGYSFDSDEFEETGLVYGKSAHAWAEAYMTGVGWVRFEPTRIKKRAESYSWGLKAEYSDDVEGYNYDPNSDMYAYYKEYFEKQYGNSGYEEPLNEFSNQLNEKERALREKEKKKKFIKETILVFGRYILIILGFILTLFMLYKLIRLYIYNKMSPRDKLMENMKQIYKKLDRTRHKDEENEQIDEELQKQMDHIFKEYYRVRFRGGEPSDELIDITKRIIKKI